MSNVIDNVRQWKQGASDRSDIDNRKTQLTPTDEAKYLLSLSADDCLAIRSSKARSCFFCANGVQLYATLEINRNGTLRELRTANNQFLTISLQLFVYYDHYQSHLSFLENQEWLANLKTNVI
jgi:hypothetical protein